MTTDTPTQQGGETDSSVEGAAERVLGLLDAIEPPKTEDSSPAKESEPTPSDGKTETEAKTEEGDAQKVEFETIEQLAEATGLPLESILNLKARANVDGEESTVPISEILKSYQLSKHVNNQSQELANQRKAFEAEQEKKLQEVNHRLTEAQVLSQQLEADLVAEHNQVDWTTLRNTDPAEFAARKQEYNERWNRIQGMKNKALSEAYRISQESQQKQTDEQTKLVQAERKKWPEAIPEWRDKAKFESDRVEIVSYLRNMGFSDTDIASVYDARQMKMIRNAMLYEKASKKATIEQKKVVNLPKVLKPGTQTTKSDTKTEKDKELEGRLRKTGKLDDAAAMIERMMK